MSRALVLAVLCCSGGAVAGGAVASQLVVPSQVHLPVGDALSEYGLKVRWYESLRRNDRQTVGLVHEHVDSTPVVFLRYYPPRSDMMTLSQRFDANRFAGPGQWFHRSCDPESTETATAAAVSGTSELDAPGTVLLYPGVVEQTELGLEVDYVKRCPQQPSSDRHGRLLMMMAPDGDGAVIMLDADLEGAGSAQGSAAVLRERLHDVAERVRKLD